MPRPKTSDWEKHEELLNAGTKGWNPLQRLPILLAEEFDWAREFVFGFFVEDEVPEASSYGWKHVSPSHFDVKDFNAAVATPFGLTDSGGALKWRKNYLMFMPKDFRRRQMDRRHEEYRKNTAAALDGAAYAHPEDPRYQEMLEASRELGEGFEYKVKVGGEPQQDKE